MAAGQLHRQIHLGGACLLGLGSILGSGVFVSLAIGASVAGPLLLWAIGAAALVALCNGLSSAHETVASDVPEFLKQAQSQGRRFDLIVSDPPNFAPNEASVPAALRSYRALHRASLALLEPGGIYVAASCSSHIRSEAFLESLRSGSGKRVLQVLEQTGAPFDHPRLVAFPEGDYLKVVFTRG